MTRNLLVLVIALFSTVANAEIIIQQQAGVALTTEYQTNPQLLEQGRESVWIYRVVPSYELSLTRELSRLFGNIRVVGESSSNSQVVRDRADPAGTLGFQRELERGRARIRLDYARDTARNTQFTQTGVVLNDIRTITKSATADWTYALTDRFNLALEAQHQKQKFIGVNGGAGGLTGFSVRYIDALLSYQLTERMSPFFRTNLNQYRAENVDPFSVVYKRYLIGSNFTVSPSFDWSVATGVTTFTGSQKDEWIGQARMRYSGDKHSVDGSVERMIVPGGLGNLELIDFLSVAYQYDLSDRSSWGTTLGLSRSRIVVQNDTQDINSWYNYNLTESLAMRFYLQMRNIKREDADSVNGNTLGVTFTYNTPQF